MDIATLEKDHIFAYENLKIKKFELIEEQGSYFKLIL